MERSNAWLSIELFDMVFFGYVLTICILLLIYGGPGHQIVFALSVHLAFGVVGAIVVWAAHVFRGPASIFCRVWYVPFLYVFIFEALGQIVHLLQDGLFDAWVLRLEKWVFGGYPTMWLQDRATWWLTEMMALFYMSYYVVPFILGAALWRRKDWRKLNEAVLTTSVAFFFCFLHYLVMPVAGPVFIPDCMPFGLVSLKAGPLTEFEQWLFARGAIRGAAFPSSHVAVAVAVMVLALRYRFFRVFYVIVVAGLGVSTVYHGYHYGVDVLYGFLVGVVAALISPVLNRMWRDWWTGGQGLCNRAHSGSGQDEPSMAKEPNRPPRAHPLTTGVRMMSIRPTVVCNGIQGGVNT